MTQELGDDETALVTHYDTDVIVDDTMTPRTYSVSLIAAHDPPQGDVT